MRETIGRASFGTPRGAQTQAIDALGNLITYQYDAASRRTVRIDGRGLYTSYAYDAASRLTGQQYQDGTRVTMTYDADSRRTVLSDWTGSCTSSYDPDSRLSSVVNPAGIAITYGYDSVGQRASMAQPTGLFTYVFDPVGRIGTLTNPENQVSSWQYDAASRVTANILANGTQASYTYDHADRLLLLANITSGGTTLSSFNYTYNPVGNRTQVVEADGDVVTWSYDPTYQLTNERRSGANAYNITYAYDGVGNRTLLLNGGAATTSTYNAANELATSQSSAGVTTYAFDGDGNLLTSQAPGNQWTTNTWDGENRLTRVALPTGIVDSFTYNGDGQRVQKQDSTGTTNHLWDGQNILLETNASNIIQVAYTLEPALYGNLISQSQGGAVSFYLFDGLGSTRQLANSTGSVTDNYTYDAFGNILLAGSTVNPFRYVGRLGYQFDQDLVDYYVRARFYSTVLGRFVARDPLSYSGANLNPYDYASNNPERHTDASGLQAWDWPLQLGQAYAYCAAVACTLGQKLLDPGVPGAGICCSGFLFTCIYPPFEYPYFDACIRAHEQSHVQNKEQVCDKGCGIYVADWPPKFRLIGGDILLQSPRECAAYRAEYACLTMMDCSSRSRTCNRCSRSPAALPQSPDSG